MVGRATRLAPYLAGLDKTYLADPAHRLHVGQRRPRGADRGVRGARRPRPRWRRCCPGSSASQRQRVPGPVGRAGRRASGSTAAPAAARRSSCPSARSRSTRCGWCDDLGDGAVVDRGALRRGHLRAPARGRHRRAAGLRRLLRGPAAHGRGEPVGRRRRRPGGGRRRPAGSIAAGAPSAHLPGAELSPDEAVARGCTGAAGAADGGRTRRPVALAADGPAGGGRRGRDGAGGLRPGGGAGGPPVRRYQSLGDLPLGGPRRVVAIGTFDGVHVGHQAVIRRAIEIAPRARASRRWR